MAETIALKANKGIYVDSLYPDSTFNSSPLKLLLSDTAAGNKTAFVTFDTSELKEGKKITGLKIKLYITKKAAANINLDLKYISAFVFRQGSLEIEEITHNKAKEIETVSYRGNIELGSTALNSYNSATFSLPSNAITEMYKAGLTSPLGFKILGSFSGSSNYSIEAEFADETSNNPPIIEVTQEDVTAYATNLAPASGFIKVTEPVTFSWGVGTTVTQNVWGELKPQTAILRYKKAAETEYNEIVVEGESYTFPANTLPYGDLEWNVEIVTNAGTTVTSRTLNVSSNDAAAISEIISPNLAVVNRAVNNTFTWNHTTEYGTKQTAADLQYSTDQIYWENLISVTGSEQSVIIPANTLPIGTVYWRVRTYNASEIAGEWSQSAVILVEGSIVPVVSSVSNEAFVNVTWTAEQQQGYEIIIESENGTYKSDVQLGTEKQYRFKKPLADGNYMAKVRVYHNNGEVSPWAEYPFTLSTKKPTAPIISASPIINGVKINVVSENDGYILRNGEVIGKTINGEFIDYTSAGENLYIARAVNESYDFADSVAIKASAVIVGSVIATADKPKETLKLSLNLNGQPQREFSWEQMGGITHYAGRKYPVYEHAEQESESYNFAFAFRTHDEYEKFINLAKQKKPILYRDQYGLKVYGIITGVSPSVSWAGYAVTFSVTKIDFNEAVEYDL